MPEPHARQAGHPLQLERRSRSAFNRCRRFLNNYWLVPVVVIYLQLLAAMMSVHGTGETGFMARNQAFLEGIPLSFRILAHDFPYAVVGHAKELRYHLGDGAEALPPMAVADAVQAERRAIYGALTASIKVRDTEVGGVVMLGPAGQVEFRPVPSSNGAFVRELEGLDPDAALERLKDPANRPLLTALAGGRGTADRIIGLMRDPQVADDAKGRAFGSFLYALEVTSEARYMLLPMELKAFLGHQPEWRYLGMYHFHNELDSPPSDADVAASSDVRQLVITLAPDGFDLYDLYQGRATVSHHPVSDEEGRGRTVDLGTTRI
jgi:hypothetical protein